mmetsp:Transcript_8810/g.27785  ORF Transcript_8810/g.27785 Transcript_8810/m.27785 type:complete len:347 (-) Transcript_8810:215-1255(-)
MAAPAPARDALVKLGCSSWSMCAGVTRCSTAWRLVTTPSCTMSTAICTAALPVRFPSRVCSMYSTPSCTVNSQSCTFFMCFSSSLTESYSSRYTSGMRSSSVEMGSGVRMPATTSSPCALIRYSPYSLFSPVDGLRVNSTPVPLLSEKLPYAMYCTLTAVPLRLVILLILRYLIARGLFQERNTAMMAMCSCWPGSSGNGVPVPFSNTPLYSVTSSFRSSALSSMSSLTPRRSFMACMASSNFSCDTPHTTSPNMSTKRRYASYTKRGLPVLASSAAAVFSFRPRLSTVSIMPGIEIAAPERTETSSGRSPSVQRSPNTALVCACRNSMLSWICACRSSGKNPFLA